MRKRIINRGRMKAAAVVHLFKRVEADYGYNPDVFSEDSARVASVKRAVSELPDVDRIIMILYSELQSYSELGKVLNCSKATAHTYVKRIRLEVLNKLKTV